MSWSKLAPIAKTTGRPMASASIVVNKDQIPKISLILSASLKDEFGDPSNADVSAGEGEHQGSLLVEFHDGGAFAVKRFVHGGARIFVPVPEDISGKPVANAPCVVGDKVGVGGEVLPSGVHPSLVLKLPLAAWKADLADRLNPPPRKPAGASEGATSPAPKVGAGDLLDVAAFLQKKGHAVARLAENRFQIDGSVKQFGEALRLVNDYRKDADLDPLPAHKAR